MKRHIILVVLILAGFLVACSSSENIYINLEPVLTSKGLSFDIETNLPNKSKGVVTLIGVDSQFTAQDEIAIENGRSKTNLFTSSGKELDKGNYTATLTFMVTENQPEEVVKVVGDNYSRVNSDYLTDLGGFKFLEKKITLTID